MKSRDLSNLFFLALTQGANALVPFVLFPFSLSVLGAEAYATMVQAEVVAIMVLCVAIYSYDVDGVADISRLNPEERAARSQLFCDILASRLLLLLFSAALALLVVSCFLPKALAFVAVWLLVPLAYVLQSSWAFQGLQQNAYVGVSTAIGRLVSLGAVLMFVHGPSDGLLVPAFVGGGILIASLFSLWCAFNVLEIDIRAVGHASLLSSLRRGKYVFFGNLAVLGYRDINVVLLAAAHLPDEHIAAYSLAEKIVKGLQAVARPLNQLYFTKVVILLKGFSRPGRDALLIVLRCARLQICAACALVATVLVGCLVFGAGADWLRRLPDHELVLNLVGVMAPSIVFGMLNFMLGTAGLNVLGRREYMFRALTVTSVASLVACVFLASWFGVKAAASVFLASEMLLLALILVCYGKDGFERG